MSLLRLTVVVLALLAPSLAQAAAGQVLFALGRVEIQRGGQVLSATRGTAVEVGDVVTTGPTGMVQLRMQDGALLSLRYGSSLQVEEYRMPVAATAAAAPAGDSLAASGGRSALRLLRGAFRTVTGLIGKSPADSYSVATPVATIGIRGTDYSAAYCSGDCGGTANGLYLGVSNGGIEVANSAGSLTLGNDQYGYVRDGGTPPARELVPPAVLDAPTPRDGPSDGAGSDTASPGSETADSSFSEERAYETGGTQPEGDYEVRSGQKGGYAYASPGLQGADQGTVFADDGALMAFHGEASASIGSAANFDVGEHAATGLQWGRWHGGTATFTTADGTSPIDLTTKSLHWIYSVDENRAALPTTGSQSYSLVGGTNPTDNSGNVGTLDNATLFATFDFTNRTVSSSVDLSFSDGTGGTIAWSASGSGGFTADTFSGSYSTVLIDGQPGGSGSFSGFFTGGGAGAALTYELTDSDFVTSVNGAAAFEALLSPAAP